MKPLLTVGRQRWEGPPCWVLADVALARRYRGGAHALGKSPRRWQDHYSGRALRFPDTLWALDGA